MIAENSNSAPQKTILYGVIGAGTFGIAIANMIASKNLVERDKPNYQRQEVLIFSRRPSKVEEINSHQLNTIKDENYAYMCATNSIEELCNSCRLIFVMIPSNSFRSVMQLASPYLRPNHMIIHGTKGLNVCVKGQYYTENNQIPDMPLQKEYIKTMSKIIMEETLVIRIGCLSGPNLAREMMEEDQLSAAVIATGFEEVFKYGKEALHIDKRYRIYRSEDLWGVEVAGVLKNIMAIAAGILDKLGYEDNTLGLFLTRGLGEIVRLGVALGCDPKVFYGIAGIGDLITTCNSKKSRNYRVGEQLADDNNQIEDIVQNMPERAEGINTVKIAYNIALANNMYLPIIKFLYQRMYNKMPIKDAIDELLQNTADTDVEYWKDLIKDEKGKAPFN